MNTNYTRLISVDDAEYRPTSLGPTRRPRTPTKTSPYPSNPSSTSSALSSSVHSISSSSVPSSSVPSFSVPSSSVLSSFVPSFSVPSSSVLSSFVPSSSVPSSSVPSSSVPSSSVPSSSVPSSSIPSAPVQSAVPLPSAIHAASSSTPSYQQSLVSQASDSSGSPNTRFSDQPNDSRMRTRSQKQIPSVRIQSLDNAATVVLIPKPEGENGRPRRGGYSLKTALDWDPKEYKKVQDFIRELINTTLPKNVHNPFSSQPPEVLNPLRKKMVEEFPRLRQYEDNWATDDFIRAALKSRQIQLKNRKLRVQAAQGQAVLNMQQNL